MQTIYDHKDGLQSARPLTLFQDFFSTPGTGAIIDRKTEGGLAPFTLDWELVLLALALVGLLAAGLVLVVRVRRWRSLAEVVPTRIEHYRALLEQGILAPEEFERIRDYLDRKSSDPGNSATGAQDSSPNPDRAR
jgi:hypothetical protein